VNKQIVARNHKVEGKEDIGRNRPVKELGTSVGVFSIVGAISGAIQ
jgi:hypothetical protein